MTGQLRNGKAVRGLIVGFFAIGGLTSPADPARVPLPLLPFAAIVFVFASFSGWSMLRRSRQRSPAKNWSAPSWSSRPFSGPAHFFHTGAWSFVAFGVAALIPSWFGGGNFIFSALAIPFGAGLLAGSWIYFRINRPDELSSGGVRRDR